LEAVRGKTTKRLVKSAETLDPKVGCVDDISTTGRRGALISGKEKPMLTDTATEF
jgi:hypothetical protein